MDKNKEVINDLNEFHQNWATCSKCDTEFIFLPEEAWWNEQGTYSVKLTKCPCCKTINAVKYINAAGLYVNSDRQYYK